MARGRRDRRARALGAVVGGAAGLLVGAPLAGASMGATAAGGIQRAAAVHRQDHPERRPERRPAPRVRLSAPLEDAALASLFLVSLWARLVR